MNTFLNGLQNATNYTYTENLALTHKSTKSDLLDMFALGGAYRTRSDDDVITLFKNAYAENPVYALKCLFYMRDCRGGQGERRFFRVCYEWLIANHPDAALRNLVQIPEYGRWDDMIYVTYHTPLWRDTVKIIKEQLSADMTSLLNSDNTGISILAKWMPSENTSSAKTREVANDLRNALNMSHKDYRKVLSKLRERINVLERLMSAGRWDEIEFDKIPSRAGLIYRNAFARRDMIKAKYEAFAKDSNTKVNAKVLNPVEIAHECFSSRGYGYYNSNKSDTERAMLQKYWDNLPDYYQGRIENGIAVVDVSGSMYGQPLEAAVSLGAYVAERGKGPFANHFITFSDSPELVRFDGVDIYDKFNRARSANWDGSTNIEAVLDLMLNTAIQNHVTAEDMPKRLYIFSDMEFNSCVTTNQTARRGYYYGYNRNDLSGALDTLFEATAKKWSKYGYSLPQVVFWNLNARQNNIPAIGAGFSYVSGFSPNMIEVILSGKDGYDLMMLKLDSERYAPIQ